jgi:hypothetical protein
MGKAKKQMEFVDRSTGESVKRERESAKRRSIPPHIDANTHTHTETQIHRDTSIDIDVERETDRPRCAGGDESILTPWKSAKRKSRRGVPYTLVVTYYSR